MDELLHYLDVQCDALQLDAEDYVVSRSGDDSFYARMNGLTRGVTAKVEAACREWKRQTDGYRSLLAAYTAEREKLFFADTRGASFEEYGHILNGTLPEDKWEEIVQRLYDRIPSAVTTKYRALLDAIKVLSQQNGRLRNSILERDTVGRACRDLGSQKDLQRDALLAILQNDVPGWTWKQPDRVEVDTDSDGEDRGDDVTLTTADIVNHYHALVRHWNENKKQHTTQNLVFEQYLAVYTRFDIQSL